MQASYSTRPYPQKRPFDYPFQLYHPCLLDRTRFLRQCADCILLETVSHVTLLHRVKLTGLIVRWIGVPWLGKCMSLKGGKRMWKEIGRRMLIILAHRYLMMM